MSGAPLRRELFWRQITEARVRTHGVVVDAPRLDDAARLGTELGGAQQGIDAVNAEVKKASTADAPSACVVAVIKGRRGKEVKVLDTPEGPLAIVPFFVDAVYVHPLGLVPPSEPTVWFTLAEPKGKEA